MSQGGGSGETSSTKIAMTAPVAAEISGTGQYKVSFVMPSKYTLDTLPKPGEGLFSVGLRGCGGRHRGGSRSAGGPARSRRRVSTHLCVSSRPSSAPARPCRLQ